MSTTSPSAVEQFLHVFLTPPTGNSPTEIRQRILHWVDVVNDPAKFSDGASPHEVAAKRKTARQNLRRLLERHPEIAAQMKREREVAQ